MSSMAYTSPPPPSFLPGRRSIHSADHHFFYHLDFPLDPLETEKAYVPRRRSSEPRNSPFREKRRLTQHAEVQWNRALAVTAAKAASKAAKSAAQVMQLTYNVGGYHPSNNNQYYYKKQLEREWAATKIQAAFRAHLARKAFGALKGVVRLQALVRGHAIRVQARLALRCMQALAQLQARARARQLQNKDKHMRSDDCTLPEKDLLAYRTSNQTAKTNNCYYPDIFFSCIEPNDPHQDWAWLDNWVSPQPLESYDLDKESMNGNVALVRQVFNACFNQILYRKKIIH